MSEALEKAAVDPLAVACSNCMFWAPPHDIDETHAKLPSGWGECRRYAPRGLGVSVHQMGGEKVVSLLYNFTPMPPRDWCGEFRLVYQQMIAARPNASLKEDVQNNLSSTHEDERT